VRQGRPTRIGILWVALLHRGEEVDATERLASSAQGDLELAGGGGWDETHNSENYRTNSEASGARFAENYSKDKGNQAKHWLYSLSKLCGGGGGDESPGKGDGLKGDVVLEGSFQKRSPKKWFNDEKKGFYQRCGAYAVASNAHIRAFRLEGKEGQWNRVSERLGRGG